ncbi:MAG TPA: hypothetical protein VIV11_21350 [Kofleriaceae bacterium]
MRLLLLATALCAACRSSGGGGGSRQVVVTAFGGDRPEPGVTVIGHSPNGEVIDQTTADAVGHASVGVDGDSLISVIFPGNLSELTPVISIVTFAAPEAEIAIYGPPRSGPPPLVVGVLQVDGPNLTGADYFDIRIGCATVRATQLPASLDVGACSMGSDTKLDVLVGGYHDLGGDPPAPVLDGYAAGRVMMTNGLATLDIAAWQTTGANVPVTLDGVAPASMQMELLSDGLSFDAQPVTDHGTLWTGLVIDATRITAALPGIDAARVTTRELTGAPTAIAFSADNFLAPISVSAELTTLSPASLRWDPTPMGDAVNLHATWENGGSLVPRRVVWEVVLPPDVETAILPALEGELGTMIAPITITPIDVLVRYVDSEHHDGFATLQAAGIHAEDTRAANTIAPRPADGEIRISHAIGLR